MENFVYAFQEWRLCFPQSCRNPIIKSCCLQSQVLWGFPVPLPDLLAGKPDARLRIITKVKRENFFDIIVLQIVGGLAGRYRILFYHDCTPSYYLIVASCLWTWSIFFWDMGFQHHPVNGCSTAHYNFGALSGRDECMFFYSAILNWKLCSVFYCTIDSFNLALNSLG